jgi:hypothetical protein
MTRFKSLTQVPGETRRALRERFARYLAVNFMHPRRMASEVEFEDEAVLELYLHLRVDSHSDLQTAKAIYNDACARFPNQPSLENLIAQNWLFCAWESLSAPYDIAAALKNAINNPLPAFSEWLEVRYHETFWFDGLPTNPAALGLAEDIQGKRRLVREITCRTPQWVIARLWERLAACSIEDSTRVKRWILTSRLLGYPDVDPTEAWSESTRANFVDTAFSVLETDALFVGWDAYRTRTNEVLAHTHLQDPSDYTFVPVVPKTLVDRALWVNSHILEGPSHWAMQAWSDVLYLLRTVLNDANEAEYAPAPHPLMIRSLELAEQCPDVMQALLGYVRTHPMLLADMLLVSRFSGAACLLIAEWNAYSPAWDRELLERDNKLARDTAFVDGVSIFGHHLQTGAVSPAEAASLLRELHAQAKPGRSAMLRDRESMLAALRAVLTTQTKEVLVTAFDSLLEAGTDLTVGRPSFVAALDVVEAGQLWEQGDGASLVSAYVQSVRRDEYILSAERITPNGAAALYKFSEKLTDTQRADFLFPFGDIKSSLKESENVYTTRNQLSRAVQLHMRVLSRAVSGFGGEVPAPLVEALVKTARIGGSANDNKGFVPALAVGYEWTPLRQAEDRPLAADIAAAMHRLSEAQSERLLKALLETDEPAFLAQLLTIAPQGYREQLENRIDYLAEEDDGDTYWLTDKFARLEALLTAGALKAAQTYMDADAKRSGTPNSRQAVSWLRLKLRLALLKQEWSHIDCAEVPSGLSQQENDAANDIILFFKGAAQLQRENGSAEYAERLFGDLRRKRPLVSAYAFNMFAAQVQQIVGEDALMRLSIDEVQLANRVLADSEEIEASFQINNEDGDAYKGNKGVLLMAAGRDAEAEELLRSVPTERMSGRVAALRAVALNRLGRRPEAQAVLDWAQGVLGPSDALEGARVHIQAGGSMPLQVAFSDSDDSLPQLREAFTYIQRLDPFEQAKLLGVPPFEFWEFVTGHVRFAASSVITLVSRTNGAMNSKEDDTTGFICEFLKSRLSFAGWNVTEQPPGGFTEKENPGERDLVISKDSAELAVIEAVVCKKSPTSKFMGADLRHHFQKLFEYSKCRLFFHLTYAYRSPISAIITELEKMAEQDAADHCKFVDKAPILAVDSRPGGFRARYKADGEDILVVFLVLDMQQDDLKNAAKKAAPSAARTPRAKRDSPARRNPTT